MQTYDTEFCYQHQYGKWCSCETVRSAQLRNVYIAPRMHLKTSNGILPCDAGRWSMQDRPTGFRVSAKFTLQSRATDIQLVL